MTVPTLTVHDLHLGYDGPDVIAGLSLDVPPGEFTAVIGSNACGKSTLLKAMARLLAPRSGQVLLDGRAIAEQRTVDVARRLGLLPQGATPPDGIVVSDLVSRGRYAHQRFLRRWSEHDAEAVARAMALTGITPLADRLVDSLSGGQRQRVWLATVLAQETPLLLLDEPTTYLDVAHQLDIMQLCADLHRGGRTVVAVLHDLNHAARFATHVVAVRDGGVVAQGPPREVLTPELLGEVFGLEARVLDDPDLGGLVIVPLRSRGAR